MLERQLYNFDNYILAGESGKMEGKVRRALYLKSSVTLT